MNITFWQRFKIIFWSNTIRVDNKKYKLDFLMFIISYIFIFPFTLLGWIFISVMIGEIYRFDNIWHNHLLGFIVELILLYFIIKYIPVIEDETEY